MAHRPELVEDAHRALADADWVRARDGFSQALVVAETAEACAGLAEALWWLGEVPEAVEYGERAYAGYHRRGDLAEAAGTALWLGLRNGAHLGNTAAAAGWLARARTLVNDHAVEELAGWLALYEADASGPVAGEALARQARDLARTYGDSDLELCAISEIGAKLIEQGRVYEGMSLLDEAMAGALGGEGGALLTVAYASCNTMESCVSSAAFDRAVGWIHAADRFTRRFGCPFIFARCRTLYGAMLAAVGDWVQAEEELQAAVRLSRDALPAVHMTALAALASLRLEQGRIEEAQRLVAGLREEPEVVPVLARLQLHRSRPANAEAVLRRRLTDLDEDAMEGYLLRELLGAAEIAQDRQAQALARGRALTEAGDRHGCEIAVARGHRLQGWALAASDSAASYHFDRALNVFSRLQMPVEVARTRVDLGRLYAGTAPEVAVEELQRALDLFEAVGAGGDADLAAALLRDLGARPARTGTNGAKGLSPREREVFRLLGEGLSNLDIAERLYISHRTVEHHVARVIDKLGLRTRAEAVAEAVRTGPAT